LPKSWKSILFEGYRGTAQGYGFLEGQDFCTPTWTLQKTPLNPMGILLPLQYTRPDDISGLVPDADLIENIGLKGPTWAASEEIIEVV